MAAIALALVLQMSAWDIALVVFLVVVVLAAELFNTAIETLVDLVSPEYHPLAKTAKDVAAAAVLVCAVGAVFVGLLLFAKPIYRLILL